MVNTVKVTPEEWLEAAKTALVEEGVPGVKVDRIAKAIGVTRGGFYHHFKNQQDLIDRLIKYWAKSNDMLPIMSGVSTPDEALAKFNELIDRLIMEEDFSPAFDLAVREWGRVDKAIQRSVDKVDNERIKKFTQLFLALGCERQEAPIRARVFYYHQIGFYALSRHNKASRAERFAAAPIYLRILCGRRYADAVELKAPKWA